MATPGPNETGSPYQLPVTITCNPTASSDPTIGLLTSDRDGFANWSRAGLLTIDNGAIPSRTTQCGSTVSPTGTSSDYTNIVSAISACTAGDFVNLASGVGAATYSGYIAGNTLHVTSSVTGTIAVGQVVVGGYNGTVILSGAGTTWTVSGLSQTVGSSGSPVSFSNTTPFLIPEGDIVQVNKGITVRGAVCTTTPCPTILMHPPGQDSTNNGCNSPGSWGATLGSECAGNSPSQVINLGGSGSIAQTTTLSANGAQGSYTVSVTSTAGISVGSLVMVDELAYGQAMPDCCFNGGTGYVWASQDYRYEANAHNPPVAGNFDSACYDNSNFLNGGNCAAGGNHQDACGYSIRCGGLNEELHLVTAVNGNTITFDSPLTLSYRTANGAQLYVFSNVVSEAGLENVTVEYGDNGNVTFNYCQYCWAYKVESNNWLNGGFQLWTAAFRDQLDTFYTHNAAWPVNGGAGYCISLTYGSSEDLIWNGISVQCNKQIVVRASGSGVVVAYNYMDQSYINGNPSWIETGDNCSHLEGSHFCLAEGNQTNNIDDDFTHGNSTHNTWYRNWATGFRNIFLGQDNIIRDDASGCCAPLRAIAGHPYGYWDNYIGNVAGMPGQIFNWAYRCNTGLADSGCAPVIYNFGWNDVDISGALSDLTLALSYPIQPSGANATITGPGCLNPGTGDGSSYCVPIVAGNFDYQTDAVAWNGITPLTLPNSFFLTSQTAPVWWPSGYPWPWVTPQGNVPIQPGKTNGTCNAASYDGTYSSSASLGSINGSYVWTLPHAIPAGDTAILTLIADPGNGANATSLATVSDNSAIYNSWRQTDFKIGVNRAPWGIQQLVDLKSNGATTITISSSSSSGGIQYTTAILDLFQNINAIDGSTANYQNAPGTGTNAINSGNMTALYSGDLIYAAANSAEGYPISTGTGFTTGQSGISEYILSSTGTGTKTATFSSSNGTDEYVIAALALRCSNTLSPLPARARFDAGTPFTQP